MILVLGLKAAYALGFFFYLLASSAASTQTGARLTEGPELSAPERLTLPFLPCAQQ